MLSEKSVFEFIEASSVLAEKLEKHASDAAAERARVEAELPATIQALQDYAWISDDAGGSEKLAAALSDPVEALKLLRKVAARKSASELAGIGEPVAGHANGNGAEKLPRSELVWRSKFGRG